MVILKIGNNLDKIVHKFRTNQAQEYLPVYKLARSWKVGVIFLYPSRAGRIDAVEIPSLNHQL